MNSDGGWLAETQELFLLLRLRAQQAGDVGQLPSTGQLPESTLRPVLSGTNEFSLLMHDVFPTDSANGVAASHLVTSFDFYHPSP